MPSGYWSLGGWRGYKDARALYITFIGNGKKLPNITDPATTATVLQVDEPHQDPMLTELVGTEIVYPDDDSVEDIQSTGEDSIDRLILIGHMNISKKGELGEVDEIPHVYQDTVGDQESNEESANTNRFINRDERGPRRGSHKRKQTKKIAAYNPEGQKKKPRLSLGMVVERGGEMGD